MEACILRFNRRRRQRSSLVLPFVDVACFLVHNEGCTTVLFVGAWETHELRDAADFELDASISRFSH